MLVDIALRGVNTVHVVTEACELSVRVDHLLAVLKELLHIEPVKGLPNGD